SARAALAAAVRWPLPGQQHHAGVLRGDSGVSRVDVPGAAVRPGAADRLRRLPHVRLLHRYGGVVVEVARVLPGRSASDRADAGAAAAGRRARRSPHPDGRGHAQRLLPRAGGRQLRVGLALARPEPGPALRVAVRAVRTDSARGLALRPVRRPPSARPPTDVSTRILVLGIDAGNRSLLERWAADGLLPNIR